MENRAHIRRLSRGNQRDPAIRPLSLHKNVSRRREMKGRLRRDDRVGYRGVSGFYDPAIPLFVFLAVMAACVITW